ncbi:hypothetical protein FRC03_005610 [Tulasnella sp. 419]|nr:hypothetical protein FRC03_005610 [Tulasnella sp. 419]
MGSTIFNSYAEDTVSGRSLTLAERWRLVNNRGSHGRKEKRGQLPDLTRVAVGMKVMVTVNVETDLDIANGLRGVITGLVLDEADKDYNQNAEEVNLTWPPLYILVKLQQTSTIKLPGLEENEIPIAPMCKNYMGLVGGHCKSIKRRQLPLTAAYSFTDYQSQGQTIPYVIVNIATPPSKGITAFNVYVALSRSLGRDTI